jgi:endonuclease YncB( thermonuclease family)
MNPDAILDPARGNHGGTVPRGAAGAGNFLQIRAPVPSCLYRALFFCAAMASLATPGLAQAAAGLCPADGSRHGTVASVNERLELTLVDGIQLKIAGVDPPRPTPGDTGLDVLARDRLAEWLAGHEIGFRPIEASVDRWGRTPAFVFAAGQGPDTPPVPVGEALLDAGLARYEPGPAARPCKAPLLAAEAAARAAGLGLWADPYYAVIAAADRPSFAEKVGTAVIVEGRITAIADRRPRIMLYFGPRQGWDFSVTIFQRNGKAFEAAFAALAALSGQTVRVRGLLDTRFGPQIELLDPDEIEVIESQHDAEAAPPGIPAPR